MSFGDNFTDAGKVMTFFLEIGLTSGYITEIVAQRSGHLQIQNFMWPSEQLLIYAMWPPEAHKFDTPVSHHYFCSTLTNRIPTNKYLSSSSMLQVIHVNDKIICL